MMKRFYKHVDVQEASGRDGAGWQVTLDGRGIKTVKGMPQIVPTKGLALDLASEWRGQEEKIDPATFPMRDMADYAIDIVAPHPAGVAHELVAYGDTDTLLYRADPDEPLFARQMEVWEPIVAAFEAREGVELTRVSGIIHRPQSEETMAKLRERLERLDPFALAGIQTLTNLAASLIIGLTAGETPDHEKALSLWEAAELEEGWQAELWGRDEEAEARRAKRKSDFLMARHVARLAAAA